MSQYIVRVEDRTWEVDVESEQRAAARAVANHFGEATPPPSIEVEVFRGEHLGRFRVTANNTRKFEGRRAEAETNNWTFHAERV